jgi:hypothetical protein
MIEGAVPHVVEFLKDSVPFFRSVGAEAIGKLAKQCIYDGTHHAL